MIQPGYRGWVAAACVVLAAEALDSQTMSSAWKATPKFITIPVTIYTVAHLYGKLPENLDLFVQVSKMPIPHRSRGTSDA